MGIQKSITPIILCADDYAVTEAVGEAIRQLVAARRLSAVSCLSGAPAWSSEADLLKPLRKDIDVGLHFNLTLGFAQQPPKGLADWLRLSLTGQIDHAAIERELHAQLDLFESAWGEAPDFVDGHQHIHIFPGIRHSFFRTLAERYPHPKRPWIRQVNPPLTGHDAPFKALILKLLGRGFIKEAQHVGFDLPNGFAGLYSLSPEADFPAMMAGWLLRARANDLLMCHPSSSAEGDPDNVGAARLREYDYLCSEEFEETRHKENIALSCFCR